jgi:hypothetical protein
MTDKDQHLLWEAYLEKSKPDHQEDKKEDKKGKYDDGDGKKERCDYVPCEEEADQEEDHEDKEVQEEMDNLEFSAAGRESPEQAVFNAVVSWMKADTEGLTTPEDYEGYSMSDAFDDAKEFIRDVLQDISFSEVKSHLSGMVSLHDSEEAAFETSVDDAIRFDDSRLQDMPPREPGV